MAEFWKTKFILKRDGKCKLILRLGTETTVVYFEISVKKMERSKINLDKILKKILTSDTPPCVLGACVTDKMY